jgi:hypothetical protein
LLCMVLTACFASWADLRNTHAQEASAIGRWQIFRADLAANANMVGVQQQPRSAFSTILIDTVTGDTWILWPSDVAGKQTYTWTPIEKAKPNAAAQAFPPQPIGVRPAAK